MTTLIELKDFVKKNPKAKATFTGYYKYVFSFKCEIGCFGMGACQSDIYRFAVESENLLSELLEYDHIFLGEEGDS